MLKKVAKSSQYKFYCESCDYGSNKKINFEKHLLTKKHNAQKCSKKVEKSNQYKFYCESCDYNTNKKTDFEKHLLTKKHNAQKSDKVATKSSLFFCDCGKEYKHQQSLQRHKITCVSCKICNEKIVEKQIDYKDMFIDIMNENKELRKTITDMVPKIGNNNNSNNTNNFNINVFLNEKCKDAINIDQFIKSIEISLEQLDFTKQNGLAEGLGNLLIENMNKLSIYERPVHCTDVKRETLYIKDNDNWERDNDKFKIKRAIREVSNKQFKSLEKWNKQNLDLNSEEKKDEFIKILTTVSEDCSTIDNKIIKKICNKSYLDKK
jgi:hypothetical protein